MLQAYDRSAVNRPTECGEPSILKLQQETMQNPLSRVRTLHTHFNQDNFGPDVPIYYGLLSLWDMNARTGGMYARARALCPARLTELETRWSATPL